MKVRRSPTPNRWADTIGWLANLLEMFPDNPFSSGAALVANAIVWMANQAGGELPGFHAMSPEGSAIEEIQGPPGPPLTSYSALAANYHPAQSILQRFLDAGGDQFFGSSNDLVVPAEGCWRIDRSGRTFIPAARIGCFGPGGNIAAQGLVTHFNVFACKQTVDFLINALADAPQRLSAIDPAKALPDRRLLRDAAAAAGAAPLTRSPGPASDEPAPKGVAEAPLRVTVSHGDLSFESATLILGHYRSGRLTGTEAVVNRSLGNVLKHSLDRGLYPNAPGSHQIFVATRPAAGRDIVPHPAAVIVAGLGEEGKLHPADLVRTVRQAVIAWAQRVAENGRTVDGLEVASTLMGSGGTGVSAADSARLIVQGALEANGLLKEARADYHWPGVTHLRFIELYLDRATEAWHALRMQQRVAPGRYVIDEFVATATAGLQRPLMSRYRGTDYALISIAMTGASPEGERVCEFTLDTQFARTEVRGRRIASALIRDLIAQPSNDRTADPHIGRTLYELLIPIELEPFIGGSEETHLELDAGTAAIPWELLEAPGDRELRQPWTIRCKLLRQLRTSFVGERVVDAAGEPLVLLIGEPECPPEFPRLPGASAEVAAVYERLTALHGLDRSFVSLMASGEEAEGPSARQVVNALHERPWQVMHLAGHAVIAADGAAGGLLLSNGAILGPREVAAMRRVPDLLFVNCCHLPTRAEGGQTYDRAAFAAALAEALILSGVRCVVVAGWAVDDEAAATFATAFYEALLRGNRFIDAAAEARAAAYVRHPGTTTWAAYQCYGDAEWVLRRAISDAVARPSPPVDEWEIASASELGLMLERLTVEARFRGADPAVQLSRLQRLAGGPAQRWAGQGDVAERFGTAFAAAGAIEAAIEWVRTGAGRSGRYRHRSGRRNSWPTCVVAWRWSSSRGDRRTRSTVHASRSRAPSSCSRCCSRLPSRSIEAICWVRRINGWRWLKPRRGGPPPSGLPSNGCSPAIGVPRSSRVKRAAATCSMPRPIEWRRSSHSMPGAPGGPGSTRGRWLR